MHNVIAYHMAENIDLDAFKKAFKAKVLHFNNYELFYSIDSRRYLSLFNYGVVCFLNYDEKDINEFMKTVALYLNCFFFDNELTKEYEIEVNTKELRFGVGKIKIIDYDLEVLRIIMRNVAKSVALDYYFQQAKVQLSKSKTYTSSLEKEGKIDISDQELKKFVGRTHNLKNQIVENINLLDSYSDIGQNDYLIRIDDGMKGALYMKNRTNNIYEELRIIREHLECFNDIVTQTASHKLEWIIIILLFVFVIDIIVERLF